MTTNDRELRLELPGGFWQARLVLVAVSGGSDSLALVRALLGQRSRLAQELSVPEVLAFHFDHQWHDGSAALARWVEQTLQECGVATIVRRRSDISETCSDGSVNSEPSLQSEGEARELRYKAMTSVAKSLGASFVLTGHTCDDQAETVLMRIARGTGLAGLAGIPQQRPLTDQCTVLRPLLHESRQRLREYLSRIGQAFWDDPTNTDDRWTRNRVRQTVLPWLRQNLAPEIDQALVRLGDLARDHQVMVQHLAEQHRAAVLELGDNHLIIDVKQWEELPESLVRSLLVYWWGQAQFPQRDMDFEHWSQLTTVARRPESEAVQRRWPSQVHLPAHIVAKRSGGVLRIVAVSRS